MTVTDWVIITINIADRCSHRLDKIQINMLKIVHISFAFMTLISFVGRIILSETCPKLLERKVLKIAPHVIDTLLLVTGITLVFQGNWLSGQYDWIIAKFAALFGYIGFGVVAMRHRGMVKWLAFAGAIACFIYIGDVAVTKQPWFL